MSDVLKQSKRSSGQHDGPMPRCTLVATLLAISKSTRALAAIRLREIGLVAGQDQLLNLLSDETPLRSSDLAVTLNVRASTVAKMLNIMEDKGLLQRGEGTADARRTTIALTGDGRIRQGQVRTIWSEMEADFLHDFPAEAADELRAALKTMDAVLKRLLSRLR